MNYVNFALIIFYIIQLFSVIFNNYNPSKFEIICMLIVCILSFVKDFIFNIIEKQENDK